MVEEKEDSIAKEVLVVVDNQLEVIPKKAYYFLQFLKFFCLFVFEGGAQSFI